MIVYFLVILVIAYVIFIGISSKIRVEGKIPVVPSSTTYLQKPNFPLAMADNLKIAEGEDSLFPPSPVSKDDLDSLKSKQNELTILITSLRNELADIRKGNDVAKCDESSSIMPRLYEDGKCDCSEFNAKLTAVDSKIENIELEWSKLTTNIDNMKVQINNIEQYGRLYNLILDDVSEVPVKLKGLKFSAYIVNFLNCILARYLGFHIQISDIDISHPLYSKKSNGKYVLIIRFTRRDVRNAIFDCSNILYGWGITVRDNLTEVNRELFHLAKSLLSPYQVVSEKCVIYAVVNGKKCCIQRKKDIYQIIEQIGLSSDVQRTDVSHVMKPTVSNLTLPTITNTNNNSEGIDGNAITPALSQVFASHETRTGSLLPYSHNMINSSTLHSSQYYRPSMTITSYPRLNNSQSTYSTSKHQPKFYRGGWRSRRPPIFYIRGNY